MQETRKDLLPSLGIAFSAALPGLFWIPVRAIEEAGVSVQWTVPVDDSTLTSNAADYLDRHLREVIGDIERTAKVELMAIGIGHDVTQYYKKAITIHNAGELGGAMTTHLTSLFAD